MNPAQNFVELGYVRVAAVAPVLNLADPMANAEQMAGRLRALERDNVSLVLFPELSLTGYTCEDLFFTDSLHQQVRQALAVVAAASRNLVSVVGVPWQLRDGRLLNCAAVLAGGRVRGLVPKTAHPNYGEFYERRWFVSGAGIDETVHDETLGTFDLCREQLFELGAMRFAIEICEDLWSPRPPGIDHCLAGAELILNLSASNELVAKADYRRDLVHMASAQGICGYLYASSGPMESTKDMVFGGHLLACEDGRPLAESERFSFEGETIVTEIDVQRLRHERMQNTTFANAPRPQPYRTVATLAQALPLSGLQREYHRQPFVPGDEAQFDARAREILSIQSTGLARRMLASRSRTW
ncbi:MAG: nitrilase-related carbon-nitrogen hydrolase [Pseudomonadales bacterium]